MSPADGPLSGILETAGERLQIDCEIAWVADLIQEAAPGEIETASRSEATVAVRVEDVGSPFEVDGWEPLARGAWRRDGRVVVENACGSGFDLRLDFLDGQPRFACRWRPPLRERMARFPLSGRFHALARAALLQYPAMWWAGIRGRAPLHATTWKAEGLTPLVAGAPGAGRSTLLARELAVGAVAISDNLCVADGATTWGLVEPMRLIGGSGRRMAYSRRERQLPNRVPKLDPDRVIVLRRGEPGTARVRSCDPETATRALVTSTYMAGELRRYWAFAATLAAATGLGPAHPAAEEIASRFARRLPCIELVLGDPDGPSLARQLEQAEVLA